MIRCLEWTGILFGVVALAGCASFSSRLGNSSILGGYKLMDAASSDVPIGALWRQGYGPVGPQTGADNIVTRRSFSSLTLSRAAQRGLEVKLAEMLDLHPGFSGKLSATVSEMSISSVRDTTKLGLKPGDAFLSDALKASKITITTESNIAGDLAASLEARGLAVSGQANVDGQQTLAIEGVDLFFAYRVARVGKGPDGPLITTLLSNPRAPGW